MIVCVCILASVVQHAKSMRLITLSSVAKLALPYSSTLSHKRYHFRKKVIEHKLFLFFFIQILSEAFLILRRTQRHIITNMHWSPHTVPAILLRFWCDLKLFSTVLKISKYQNSWKSVQLEPSFSMRTDGQTDRQTDMKKVIVVFFNFPNPHTIESSWNSVTSIFLLWV
jgi:hypothetical protein